MLRNLSTSCVPLVALLAEGVGRNSYKDCAEGKSDRSPSSRRAWVEIPPALPGLRAPCVALLAEGVGRNYSIKTRPRRSAVALLAEGVGRNCLMAAGSALNFSSPSSRRAWVEIHQHEPGYPDIQSPSSRRAWVEIPWGGWCSCGVVVALLAEGVDKKGFLAPSGISWAG